MHHRLYILEMTLELIVALVFILVPCTGMLTKNHSGQSLDPILTRLFPFFPKESNPIRRYSSSSSSAADWQSNNIVIHAQVGDYVNISCWFDPKVVMRANYQLDDSKQTSGGDDDDDHDFSMPFGSFGLKRRRRRLADNNDDDQQLVKTNKHHHVRHRHHKGHSRRQIETRLNRKPNNEPFLANSRITETPKDADDEEASPKEDENHPEVKSYNVESSTSNGKYEVDWFFLDKHGRMNIIR